MLAESNTPDILTRIVSQCSQPLCPQDESILLSYYEQQVRNKLNDCIVVSKYCRIFDTRRVQIAILYFNENTKREQATTLEGEERFDVLFPKYKAGGYVVKKVKVDPTFSELFL